MQDDNNVYAAPEAAPQSADEQGLLASRWLRFFGALIDGLLGAAANFLILFSVGYWELMMSGAISMGKMLEMAIVGFVVFLLMHGYLLAKRGQTIGKMIVGTKIVSYETGEILSFGRVIGLRYLPVSVVANIPLIGSLLILVNVLFIFGKEKRCVHDHIAGTKVVMAR